MCVEPTGTLQKSATNAQSSNETVPALGVARRAIFHMSAPCRPHRTIEAKVGIREIIGRNSTGKISTGLEMARITGMAI